jgi:6-phosphogluconolactonase (cycloisomerase 2 family)
MKLSVVSLAMVLGLASCSLDYTVGYVYMTTNKSNPGLIDQYAIDFDSGALSEIGTPIAAGNNPVTLVATPSGKFVYVVNQGDSTVQEFAVQGDGTLASQHVYATGGAHPTAVAIDPQGAFLYVTNTYVAGASTGTGVVSIFPVNADNSLGSVSLQPVGKNPVGITTSYFNHYVYVVDQQTSTTGMILGFSQNTTTGALTTVSGTSIVGTAGNSLVSGVAAGVTPSAIAEDPTSRFVYVTDQTSNQLIGYSVQSGGNLLAMVNGPFNTGLYPANLTIDPTGKLIYVVNYNASSVQGYAIDSATGTASPAVGAYATATGAGPTCVAIDPAIGNFLFTSDSLDNTVTGERLNTGTGGLTAVQNSPFTGSGQPTCLTVVANGSHASQTIVP